MAAEAELVLLQLSVYQGREEGGLSTRPGGSERRSKLPEVAQQWSTEPRQIQNRDWFPASGGVGGGLSPPPMCPDSSPRSGFESVLCAGGSVLADEV